MKKAKTARRRRDPLEGLPVNRRLKTGGARLLARIPDGAAALAFFDPQYRAVLDQLKFGNEGARQKKRADLPHMDETLIRFFLTEVERCVRPSGHVMVWVDKFTLASGGHLRWLRDCEELRIVDLLSWNKLAFGMGRRLRGAAEFLIVLQREPTRAKGIWTDNSIRDVWTEQRDRDLHPHSKPSALIERLLRACTEQGDLVIDPCAGGFGVLDACRNTNRVFLGCDIKFGEEI